MFFAFCDLTTKCRSSNSRMDKYTGKGFAWKRVLPPPQPARGIFLPPPSLTPARARVCTHVRVFLHPSPRSAYPLLCLCLVAAFAAPLLSFMRSSIRSIKSSTASCVLTCVGACERA